VSYIACGYYTPGYRPWWGSLRESLDKHSQPHDYVEIAAANRWEATTLAKPGQILAAMDRHPGKTIIWTDVDCTVHGDLSPLVSIPGDIGLRYYVKRRRGRAAYIRAAAGTIVVKPSVRARGFIYRWHSLCTTAPRGDDDEAVLARTIATTPCVAISQLAPEWCTFGGEYAVESVIIHDYASRDARKISKLGRVFYRQLAKIQGGLHETTRRLQNRPLRVNPEGPPRQDL